MAAGVQIYAFWFSFPHKLTSPLIYDYCIILGNLIIIAMNSQFKSKQKE